MQRFTLVLSTKQAQVLEKMMWDVKQGNYSLSSARISSDLLRNLHYNHKPGYFTPLEIDEDDLEVINLGVSVLLASRARLEDRYSLDEMKVSKSILRQVEGRVKPIHVDSTVYLSKNGKVVNRKAHRRVK